MSALLDLCDVQDAASRAGYQQTQLGDREGVAAFARPDGSGWRQLVRVWWRTGTVGTYLKHPTQGKTQLFRRRVYHIEDLFEIFLNPRVHTGDGYHRRGGGPSQTVDVTEREVPCPLCNQMYRTMVGAVSHVESGSCPNCPGRDRAREATYQFACQQDRSARFTIQHHLLTDYSHSDHASGWQADGDNYQCNGCERGFRALSSLMQHQTARPQCRILGGIATMPRIGYL